MSALALVSPIEDCFQFAHCPPGIGGRGIDSHSIHTKSLQPQLERCQLRIPQPVRTAGRSVLRRAAASIHDQSCTAVTGLLRPEAIAPRCAEPQRRVRQKHETFEAQYRHTSTTGGRFPHPSKPWSRIEQALRSTDLLLQSGGFGAIVLDMGSLTPESASRVPLTTWFRYRAAAERTQSSILLLTQYPCTKSSAELLLRLQPAEALCDETTVFTGIKPRIEVARQRFAQAAVSNVVLLRKPPQNVSSVSWQSRTTWAGRR
jgi:recombination protein RecA